MGFRFSAAGPDDHADVLEVLSWVYSGRAPGPDETLTVSPGRLPMILRTDAGEAAAACRIHDFMTVRGARTLRSAGIAAVGTLVPFRSHGAGRALMEGALRYARDEGYAISSLFGFRESFYRAFGYEACGWRWSLEARESCLPRVHAELPVRRAELTELHEFEPVFDAMIRRHSGPALRTEADWRHRIGAPDAAIYVVGEPAEAYMAVRIKEFFGDVEVLEMAWTTRAGYDGLWAALRGAAKNQERVVWNEPPNSPFRARFDDHGVVAKADGMCMHRAVNVPAALREIAPRQGEGEFTLAVRDNILPENCGPWRVAWGGGSCEVSAADSAELRIDIRPLSQAIMGCPSWTELAMHGMIDEDRAGASARAAAFFGGLPVTYMDPF